MSWTEATFTNRSGKRQRVWVRTDDGELVIDDGRVPMRYDDSDDAKVYSAHPRNLDVNGGNGEPDDKPTKASPSSKKSGVEVDDDVWRSPDGLRDVSHDVPPELAAEPEPDDGTIDVWTDGACTGNPGPCGYGVVLRHDGDYTEIGQYIGIGTNNIAELLAIGIALEETADIDGRVRVHTDSTYSIGVLSKGWKAKANVELIGWIKSQLKGRDVEFIKVKGHAGIPLNERADRLAVAAVERRS